MKKIGFKRLIVSILLTLAIVGTFYELYVQIDGVKVEFQAKGEKEIEFKACASNKLERFKGKNCFVKKVDFSRSEKIEIDIKRTKVKFIRIDFGSSPGSFYISDLKVNGIKQEFDNIETVGIGSYEVKDGVLSASTGASFSHITFKKPVNASSKMRIDIKMFIILLTLVFLIMYKMVRYLSIFKIRDKSSRIDIAFVVMFLALLFVPMSSIDDSEASLKENRSLAKYYHLFTKGKINNAFGKNFESFFNDRFYLRRYFIKIYDNIVSKINFSRGTDKVLIGKEGWYFYKPDNSIKLFQNVVEFSDKELKSMANYLRKFNDWCEKNDKKFYYFIAPDKNKIYGEYIPYIKKFKPDEESRTNKMIRYLKEHAPKVKVIYPYEELMANKDKGLLYFKGDTHWNNLGGYYGYLALMKEIEKDFPDVKYAVVNGEKEIMGGLIDTGMMLFNDKNMEALEAVSYKDMLLVGEGKCNEGKDNSDIFCTNEKGKYRFLTLRDSFSNSLQKYYSATFSKVGLFWHYGATKSDLKYIKENADIVVLENVERLTSLVVTQSFPEKIGD